MKRIWVYPKDADRMTSKNYPPEPTHLQHYQEESINKAFHQLVTLDEVCKYLGLDTNQIKQSLQSKTTPDTITRNFIITPKLFHIKNIYRNFAI